MFSGRPREFPVFFWTISHRLGDVEIRDSGHTDRTDQNEDISKLTDDGEEQMALQFVLDEEVGFLEPRIRSSNIEDLPYEVLEKIFKIILMLLPVYLLVTHAMRTRGYVAWIEDLGRWRKI